MMEDLALYTGGAFLVTLAGATFPLLKIAWSRTQMWRLLALGSGALLGTAFMHILPEGWGLDASMAGWGSLAAFALLFALEGFTMIHSCPEYMEECPVHMVGWSAFGALSLHGLMDGFIIAVAFRSSLLLGSTVSVAVMFHKFSDGLTLSSLFLSANYTRKKSLFLSTLVALATPLGAVLAFAFTSHAPTQVLGMLMGFSAGAFIYVGAADILPRLHKNRDPLCLVLFLLSLAIMGLLR